MAADSQDIVLNDELFPNSGRREQQKRGMGPFAQQLREAIGQAEWTFTRTMRFLKNLPAFDDTADVYRVPKGGATLNF